MPFYERGDVRIHYEEVGSGFPLLVIPGGGLNSTVGVRKPSHEDAAGDRVWRVRTGEARGPRCNLQN